MHVYVEASFANAFSNKYFTFALLFKKIFNSIFYANDPPGLPAREAR